MTTTMEHIDARRAHRLAEAAVRLRLKPSHRHCGVVQGAWWPRSTRMVAELPALLTALTPRFGAVDEVTYHRHDWSPAPARLMHRGERVQLSGASEQPHVLALRGDQFGTITLLVVPPYTDAAVAYGAMTAAADVDDASDADQLLGLSERRVTDRRHARIAVQRWESEGGAVPAHV